MQVELDRTAVGCHLGAGGAGGGVGGVSGFQAGGLPGQKRSQLGRQACTAARCGLSLLSQQGEVIPAALRSGRDGAARVLGEKLLQAAVDFVVVLDGLHPLI